MKFKNDSKENRRFVKIYKTILLRTKEKNRTSPIVKH